MSNFCQFKYRFKLQERKMVLYICITDRKRLSVNYILEDRITISVMWQVGNK